MLRAEVPVYFEYTVRVRYRLLRTSGDRTTPPARFLDERDHPTADALSMQELDFNRRLIDDVAGDRW